MPAHLDTPHLPRQFMQGLFAGTMKTGMQQQVFRRITAQAQLGRQQQRRALLSGALGICENFCSITGKVAERAIDLGDRELHVGSLFILVHWHQAAQPVDPDPRVRFY